jgi:hypothetical protein
MEFTLYYAAVEADNKLSDALKAKFGALAGDKRYLASTYREDKNLDALGKAKHAADDEWLRYVQNERSRLPVRKGE